MKHFTTLITLFLLTACQAVPVIDMDTETAALLAADQAFADLSQATTPKNAFASFLAPDAMLLPRATDGAVNGYDNAISMFGPDGDPGYQLLWQPQFAEVAAAADMGWSWGQYQVVINGEIINTGKYVNIWKRQPDGSWKVRADVGNERPRADAQE